MKIAIFGGTGFIGSAWIEQWVQNGGKVVLFTRQPAKVDFQELSESVAVQAWPLQEELKVDGVINLAGETINQRWTAKAKASILESRVNTTRQIVQQILNGQLQTPTLINGSAIGFYGHSLEKTFTERDPSVMKHNDFLGNVTAAWEAEAEKVLAAGTTRLVKTRFGVVLGRDGGALSRMALPYRLFAGGPIGNGEQWVSWIHLQDAIDLLNFCLREEQLSGPVNFTSPTSCTMNELGSAIAAVTRRPHWLPLPSFACKGLLGEMSDLILKGQKVTPQKALEHGFSFQYKTVEQALRDLL
ncbi:TIGR01777 family protein [Ammoniphilus oxalaticus]|uniref:TIGR01777 family protein n=1 Tax=Ammoniphilus oxalaticus TaxID=66863 RepID=A0A419SLQ3_9BACL|nr:TIGR01777 family oxidoreductase [Ammoniphilus oxalaticus]RKD24945.1 TIGR01777 family protein [Ammoniphilus oxalaticus]